METAAAALQPVVRKRGSRGCAKCEKDRTDKDPPTTPRNSSRINRAATVATNVLQTTTTGSGNLRTGKRQSVTVVRKSDGR